MGALGRNQPCHCGSGRKYKKCCLRIDEEQRRIDQEQREYELAVENGIIDPLAGEDDWDVEPEQQLDDQPFDEFEDEYEGDNWVDETEKELEEYFADRKRNLTDEDMDIIDAWWEDFYAMEDSEELRAHINSFLDRYPGLVKYMDLENGMMNELGVGNNDQLAVDLVYRLKKEFPDAYRAGFAEYDAYMIQQLLKEGEKEQVADFLTNYRENPLKDPDMLYQVISCLMSSNCMALLSDFVPDIFRKVVDSPYFMESSGIISPMITLVIAPYLDKGLDAFRADELIADLEPLSEIIMSDWLVPESLQRQMEITLGRIPPWAEAVLTTRSAAISLCTDISLGYMGWLHRNKGMDWCTAEFFRQKLRLYLYAGLPLEKKPHTVFHIGEKDIGLIFGRLLERCVFDDNTSILAMINSVYWFAEFLEEISCCEPDQAVRAREYCRDLFAAQYQEAAGIDYMVELWQKFPREM